MKAQRTCKEKFTKDNLPKVNEIIRYGSGETALMRVTSITLHGRIYGTQFFGGSIGAEYYSCCKANEEEKTEFKKEENQRLINRGKHMDEYINSSIKKYGSWAEMTFPESTPDSVIEHLKEEFKEFINAHDFDYVHGYDGLNIEEELADVFLLLCHYCYKKQINLAYVAEKKYLINIDRVWETEPNEKGYFKHKES